MREEEAPVDKGLRAELALKERNSAIKGRGWQGGGGTIQGDKVSCQRGTNGLILGSNATGVITQMSCGSLLTHFVTLYL